MNRSIVSIRCLVLLSTVAMESVAPAQPFVDPLPSIPRERYERAVEVSVTAPSPGVFLVATSGQVGGGLRATLGGGIRATAYEFTRPLCEAPCTRYVGHHSLYTINGPRIVRSLNFSFPAAADGPFRIDVRPGSYTARIAAAIVFATGAVALVAGAGLFVDAQVRDDAYQYRAWSLPNGFDPSQSGRERIAGTSLVIGGALAMIGGMVGIVMTRTRVTIEAQRQQARFLLLPGGVAF